MCSYVISITATSQSVTSEKRAGEFLTSMGLLNLLKLLVLFHIWWYTISTKIIGTLHKNEQEWLYEI